MSNYIFYSRDESTMMGSMAESPCTPLHRFSVTITCPSLRLGETVVVQAIDAGEAKPAAIAVCHLPLKGELIDFAVREIDDAVYPV